MIHKFRRAWWKITRQIKPYTVIFYIDGDYGVHTFVERVWAENGIRAWDIAIKHARDRGNLRRSEFKHATEIITLTGHADHATY